MWGKIIIPMYRLWLHGLYGLYGPRCPLSAKRPINLISLSLSLVFTGQLWDICWEDLEEIWLVWRHCIVSFNSFRRVCCPVQVYSPLDAQRPHEDHRPALRCRPLHIRTLRGGRGAEGEKFKCQYSYQGINASEFSSFYVISGIMP